MATLNWSTLTNNQIIAFDPNVDVLAVDDLSISAMKLSADSASASIKFTANGKTITLQTDQKTLTTTNIIFADGSVYIVGDNTAATINDDAANTISGGNVDDHLHGLGGNDSMAGGDGNDFFAGYANSEFGNDTIDGGSGADTLVFGSNSTLAATVNLATGVASSSAGMIALISIENIRGTLANDSLTGNDGANTLFGNDGNDLISALGGNDTLQVSPGTDSLDGGAGFDVIDFAQSGVVYGSTTGVTVNLATHRADLDNSAAGAETALVSVEFATGTAGNDVFTGGDTAHGVDSLGNNTTEGFRPLGGNDAIVGAASAGNHALLDYSTNTNLQPVFVVLSTGIANDGFGGTDTLTNIGSVWGGSGNDFLTGGGTTRATKGTFLEIFRGNAGNDTISGNDFFLHGPDVSNDRADYSGNSSLQAVNVNLSNGVALDGLGFTDTLFDVDQVYGGLGNDTLIGGADNDAVDGNAGDDTIDGGAGSDEARYQLSMAGVIINLSASAITVNGRTVLANTADDGMAGTDTLISMENVLGSDFNDYVRGSDSGDVRQFFTTDAGIDTIDGGAGIDFYSFNGALALGGANAFIENGFGSVADLTGSFDTLINIEGLAGTHANDTLAGGLGTQWFSGRGGNNVLDGGPGNDWVTYSNDPGSVTINMIAGTASNGWNGPTGLVLLGGTDTLISIENAEASDYGDSIFGNSGNNELRGRGGDDTIAGSGGNDTLIGGAGFDVLDGGTGVDVAVYSVAFRQQPFVLNGNPLTTANLTLEDGGTLTGIETLAFVDGSKNYDPISHIAQVSRLFEAAFGRLADPLELNRWSLQLDIGTSLSSVAHVFAGGQDFLNTYGSLNNIQFANQLYLNLLGRSADPPGLANWVNFLNAGMTRGDVVIGFSESQENINNHAAQTGAGIWDINETAGTVARLYWGVLERAPDALGLASWVNAITYGMSFGAAANGFTGSAEFQNRYGSLNNTQFVDQLYLNVLGRPADPGGLVNWVNALNTGTSRGDVTLNFTESDEFQINTIGLIDQGITLL
jgi:Ca2+-binding RTX toxin-like protein